jgi:hypothetical protein
LLLFLLMKMRRKVIESTCVDKGPKLCLEMYLGAKGPVFEGKTRRGLAEGFATRDLEAPWCDCVVVDC